MKYVDQAALKQALTRVKGYVDENVRTRQKSFALGSGLKLENNILSVTLDTELYKVYPTLPAAPAAGNEGKIHLVPDTSSQAASNRYVEYLWVNNSWEEIGKVEMVVDFTPYMKKTDLTATVSSTTVALKKETDTLVMLSFGSGDFTGTLASAQSLIISLKEMLGAAVAQGFYKVSMDKKGRITGYAQVQLSDLTALGVATQEALNAVIQNLATEVTARESAISTLSNTVSSNKTALEAADSALDGRLSTAESTIATQGTSIGNNKTAIENEVSARESAISGEKTAREAADNTLDGKITAEKSAREAADTAMGTRVTAVETWQTEHPTISSTEVAADFAEVYGSLT